MSDWCATMEEALLETKSILVDKYGSYLLDDADFYRILYQLGRMRRGEWKKGEI